MTHDPASSFTVLAEALVPQGARRAQMMGRPMLSIDGRMFACLDGDVLGIRLGGETEEHGEALDIPGATLFSPGDKGRVFRDWVAIPSASADRWEEYASAAMVRIISGR